MPASMENIQLNKVWKIQCQNTNKQRMPTKYRWRFEGSKAINQVSQKLPYCLLKVEKLPKYSGALFAALTE